MKGDCLETDEVVATGHSRGDSSGPGRVLGDHLAITPETVVHRAVDETGLIDLKLKHTREILSDVQSDLKK